MILRVWGGGGGYNIMLWEVMICDFIDGSKNIKMYIKEIESCFYRFIWNGKPDKIKRLTLIGDYEKGGWIWLI